MSRIFEHISGRKFYIIDQIGDYTLLMSANEDAVDKYIVAVHLNRELKEWGFGYYFENSVDAFEEFKTRAEEGHKEKGE